jgi:hypothetical protein
MTWPAVRATLREAGIDSTSAVLAGSVPLLAHGLVDDVGDADVVVSPTDWRRLSDGHPRRIGHHGDRIAVLPGGIELFDGWYGETKTSLVYRTVVVDGWSVMGLEDVLAFKQRMRRPKDAPHLELLHAALGH